MPTTPEHWRRTEDIFHETLLLPEPTRTIILEARCGGDQTLMAELRSLLAACEAEQNHQQAQDHRSHTSEPQRVGPYLLDRLLGRGGMGAVYLAHRDDGEFKQAVAIKIIDMPLATELFRERFRSERQILANLVHPYIARLLDGGVTPAGELYLAMEYVDGVSITAYCDAHQLSLEARLQLFRKVCEAVQFAHQNLVIHRDLKPDNILVAPDGTPRLIDFGTARLIDGTATNAAAELTRHGVQAFTPRYASPEQVLGRAISTATDIYSLGVLLFVLTTGSTPYELSTFSTEEMVRVICTEPPQRPGAVKPGLDPDLDAIVLKALRKEPEQRYPTALQFAEDVLRLLEHRPVLARQGNARYLAAKFVRRHRLPLAAAALLVVTLLAGVAGVLWQAHVANRERQRAQARSADLRELSNTLLSELDDALKQISGSTDAQRLLLTHVVQHLDRLAADAHDDRLTNLDLIDAYTRLGNVQGNVYYQNVADTAGALVSFDKAVTVANHLVQLYPRDREVLRAQAAALEARGETLSDTGDAQASAASLQAAVTAYDRLVSLLDVTPALVFEAAIAYETLGNELGEDSGLADPAAATAAYHRAIAMDEQALRLKPDYAAVRRGLPLMRIHLGNVVLETDPATALVEFETGRKLQEALPDDQRKLLRQVRLYSLLERKQAAAYCELGRFPEAAPLMAKSLAGAQAMADADPKDANALGELKRTLDNAATCEQYAADPAFAPSSQPAKSLQAEVTLLEREANTLRQISSLHPGQDQRSSELALVLLKLGAARNAIGTPSKHQELVDSLGVLRHAADSPHATPDVLNQAVQAELLATPASLQDPDSAVRMAERAVAMTHGNEAEYFLLLAKADKLAGRAGPASEAAQAGLKLLPGKSKSHLRSALQAAS